MIKKMNCYIVIFTALISVSISKAEPVTELSADIGQLTMSFEYQVLPDDPNAFYHLQRTRQGDNRLFLTANNVYFDAVNRENRLVADGQGIEIEKDDGVGTPEFGNRGVNNNASFAYVRRWNAGDKVIWGLWLEKAGPLEMYIHTGGAAGARFALNIDGQEQEFISKVGADGAVSMAGQKNFIITRPGFHIVTISCLETDVNNDVRLYWLEVSGDAAENGGVVRVRWRPSATHAQFTSSQASAPIRMWIMELDAAPGTHNFYGPITTPFGYYGSSWLGDGRVSTNLNFSLWSYGSNAEEPPIEQLSQIVAIGNRDAKFGGFGHEGTGAKIRDWEPFDGRQYQRQAYALRVEPGRPTENHDTYYTYFYANDLGRWILYGIGEKYVSGRDDGKKPPADEVSLRIGSFVEVVGGANSQRTGIFERRQRYRGWVMDANGEWFKLDRMSKGGTKKATGLTHSSRGLTEDSWFYNQMGGWTWLKPKEISDDHIINENASSMSEVSFLKSEDMEALMSVPCAIKVESVIREGDSMRVIFNVRNAGDDNKVTAYWGPEDCRAIMYPEPRWPNSGMIMINTKEGINEVVIENVPVNSSFFIRLLLENDAGLYFSRETFEFCSNPENVGLNADVTGDCIVGLEDLMVLLSEWLLCGIYPVEMCW